MTWAGRTAALRRLIRDQVIDGTPIGINEAIVGWRIAGERLQID